MLITHPVKGYSGVVNVGRRFWFLDGQAEATNIAPRHRRALEEGGFDVVNPHASDESDPLMDGLLKDLGVADDRDEQPDEPDE